MQKGNDKNNPYNNLVKELKQREKAKKTPVSEGFILFFSLLAVIFLALGSWQISLNSSQIKQNNYYLEQMKLEPISLPNAKEWRLIDENMFAFRQIKIKGKYIAQKNICVVTFLKNAKGKHSAKGCWVITPFELNNGGIIFVNRGFLSQNDKFMLNLDITPKEEVSLKGIARIGQRANLFTKGPDMANQTEYVMSIERLAIMSKLYDKIIAPIYLDLSENQPGAFQAGETKIVSSNFHFAMAIIFFIFSLLSIMLSLFWLLRLKKEKLTR